MSNVKKCHTCNKEKPSAEFDPSRALCKMCRRLRGRKRRKETKKNSLPSIYQILNIENLSIYIGQTQSFKLRKKDHMCFLRRGVHENKNLQADFIKYGESSFEIEVVETFPEMEVLDRDVLKTAELLLINKREEQGYYIYNVNRNINLQSILTGKKICIACKQEKTTSHFGSSMRKGKKTFKSNCRECNTAYQSERRRKAKIKKDKDSQGYQLKLF